MSSRLVPSETVARPGVCALVRGIKQVESPWNLIVAAYLLDGPRRFNQILHMGSTEGNEESLNSRTLSRALKNLVEKGFVKRKVLNTQPVAVEYSLTAQGRELKALLEAYERLDPKSR